MGDGGVNSSIGRSWGWKQSEVREHAELLKKNGCPKMKVLLVKCGRQIA